MFETIPNITPTELPPMLPSPGGAGGPFGTLGTFSLTDPSTWAGALTNGLTSNPLGLLAAVQAGRSLLGDGRNNNNGNNNPGGRDEGKGGSGHVPKLERDPYRANPYTQQAIAQHQWVQPRNYRSGP